MNEEYLDTFNASPEEIERYELQKEIEALCIPYYAKNILKMAQNIVDNPPQSLENLMEASQKIRSASEKVQDFSEFLEKLRKQ